MKQTRPSQVALRIVLLAVAYVITGRLALLLAIPPGFATAIFPPVGVGLAAVLLWGYPMLGGVLLGSTLLNVSISWSASGDLSWMGLLVAFGIAMGSSLHNAVAAVAIRRIVGFPSVLSNERAVILFLLIGGPFACLISATWGVTVLYWVGAVSGPQYGFSWWTWWVGDGIGVLIATPLTLVLFAKPRDIWGRRLNTVGIPLLIGCAVMVLTFVRASRLEQEGIAARFQERARLMTTLVRNRFDSNSDVLLLVERFMTAAPQSQRADFSTFANKLESTHPEMQSTTWVLRVQASERAAYEESMAKQGFEQFTITERNSARQLVPAVPRDEYMVVTYAEPYERNAKALGYDLLSEPRRKQAVLRAWDESTAAMTAPVELVQGGARKAMLLLRPVYIGSPASSDERRTKLRGFISVIVNPDILVNVALANYEREDYQLQITDITETNHPETMTGAVDDVSVGRDQSFLFRDTWNTDGRDLEIKIAPTPAFIRANRSLQAWVVLAGGLGLCGLLGAFLLIMSGRTVHVEQLVQQRTLELSAVLDNAAEAIITFNAEGTIERANPATAKLFDFAPEKLLERRITDLLPQIDWISSTKQEAHQEVRGYRQDAQPLTLEMMLSRMDVHGRTLYTVMLHDISARKRADRVKSEFISTVSHELRTPLTSISGSLSLVAGGVVGDVSPEIRELIDIAKINSDRLTLLVNDILDMDKLAAGKLDVVPERIDLCAIVRQSLAQNQGYADRYGVSLIVVEGRFATTPVMVDVDPSRMLQVLANLLSNAIKFSPASGVVEVSLEIERDQAMVSVHDQGPGIPDDFRDRIFEKFAQADGGDTRARGGTGLGLSISKALVELFGGTIDFVSRPGSGSTFYFVLPLAKHTSDA